MCWRFIGVHIAGCTAVGLLGSSWVLLLSPALRLQTVENFTTHARNGYYDNIVFHRVIKGFMLQTGDPLGTPPFVSSESMHM